MKGKQEFYEMEYINVVISHNFIFIGIIKRKEKSTNEDKS